ncbi:hypothetical protein RIF29_43344 [Crotalaria pallida]|uniref:50S ribosomal protein L16, chloroplastic n=1 Tax=Crotalaria pallida TaxID=3830 RepID=A0AAN9DXL2_CROPI
MGGANAQGRSLDKRIRSRIAFFVESSTSEKKCLAEAKKRLTHFIRLANDLRFAGTTKTTISLFPFFSATFFFPRDRVGMYNHLFFEDAREPLLGQLRRKCWNLMGKDKVMELIEKFIDLGRIGEWIKGIEMMIEIILRNSKIPYGYNSYLNEVKKMRSLLSNRTNTNTLIESVKIKSVYQSASPIAQDISFQLRKKTRSFRSIFRRIVKDIPLVMKKGVEGIRICCSGRSEGAEIARTECGKYGKTSRNVFNQKIDYASAEVSTRYGISGVKVCSRGCKPDGTKLGFGRYGTQSCRAGRLSYRAIEAARRAIIGHFHRAMSGQFRKNGKIWVRVFADIPITGKPTEVRMGRGKGNPTGWIARVSTGQVLFEMDGVSLSNARQAATLAAHKPWLNCSSPCMDNLYCCRGTFSGFFPGGLTILLARTSLIPFGLSKGLSDRVLDRVMEELSIAIVYLLSYLLSLSLTVRKPRSEIALQRAKSRSCPKGLSVLPIPFQYVVESIAAFDWAVECSFMRGENNSLLKKEKLKSKTIPLLVKQKIPRHSFHCLTRWQLPLQAEGLQGLPPLSGKRRVKSWRRRRNGDRPIGTAVTGVRVKGWLEESRPTRGLELQATRLEGVERSSIGIGWTNSLSSPLSFLDYPITELGFGKHIQGNKQPKPSIERDHLLSLMRMEQHDEEGGERDPRGSLGKAAIPYLLTQLYSSSHWTHYSKKLPFSHSIDVSGLVRYSTIRDDGMQWDGW